MDMATLRQDKNKLQERISKLEREKRQEESTRLKVSMVTKSAKHTPRYGQLYSGVGASLAPSKSYTSSSTSNINVSTNAEDSYSKRNLNKSVQKTGNMYLSYARRTTQTSNRYSNMNSRKKGRTDYLSSSTNNLSSTTKF